MMSWRKLIDKLFKKPVHTGVRFPFDWSVISARVEYMAALARAIDASGETPSMLGDGAFLLEFGNPPSLHILYLAACDLAILMEPTTAGWTARQVYIARLDGEEYEGMELLFRYPSDWFGTDPVVTVDNEESFAWTEYNRVYAEKASAP